MRRASWVSQKITYRRPPQPRPYRREGAAVLGASTHVAVCDADQAMPSNPLITEHFAAGRLPEDLPLYLQVDYLREALVLNPVVEAVLALAAEMALPDWYLGAGGVSQTVWNLRHGFPAEEGIKDYDLVYFDPADLSEEAREGVEREVASRLAMPEVVLDVHNEARVHLWYQQRFGRSIDAYRSTEHAIATWPTTASSVGVRRQSDNFVVCAPFGLSDLVGMVVRPNKAIVSQDVYEEKSQRWQRRWPRLRIVPW